MARFAWIVFVTAFASFSRGVTAVNEGAAVDSHRGAPITVAVVLTVAANAMDFAGPWEVFQDATVPKSGAPAFNLYTVGDSRRAVHLTGGLLVIPD